MLCSRIGRTDGNMKSAPTIDNSRFHKSIILQLKSTQDETALSEMHTIISQIRNRFGYKIRGHEIHETQVNMERLTLKERVINVSKFCLKNDIEYLTYHVPIPRNEGRSFIEAQSQEKANEHILATMKEVELVREKCGLKSKVVIVYHLPSVISLDKIPFLDRNHKFEILGDTEKNLLDFYITNSEYIGSTSVFTLENVFPKYFTSGDNNYATINMFHPLEMVRLRKFGIKITFDLSHYNIYSNYLSHGKDNLVGDLDREVYGTKTPSWNECIDLFGDSLIQLHINDSIGTDFSGDGMNPTEGEIPIIAILDKIKNHSKSGGVVRATIELRGGHLHRGKFQKRAIEWLLTNASDVLC
jgi:hypothetical protein